MAVIVYRLNGSIERSSIVRAMTFSPLCLILRDELSILLRLVYVICIDSGSVAAVDFASDQPGWRLDFVVNPLLSKLPNEPCFLNFSEQEARLLAEYRLSQVLVLASLYQRALVAVSLSRKVPPDVAVLSHQARAC